jgi:hypothetical protein
MFLFFEKSFILEQIKFLLGHSSIEVIERYLGSDGPRPYDLALSKLERNSQKDRDDVRFLARSVPLDLDLAAGSASGASAITL